MDRREAMKLAGAMAVCAEFWPCGRKAEARGISASAFPDPPGRCYRAVAGAPIVTPLRDLYKVGPGPSSSHTIAPLRIAGNFRIWLDGQPDLVRSSAAIEAHLFGSLSATGRGHRTDRAIIAGLIGQKPETCDAALMDALGDATRVFPTTIAGRDFHIGASTIVWDKVDAGYPFADTVVMRLVDGQGRALAEREYYSTGGGFFQWKGQPRPISPEPVFRYSNMNEFKTVAAESGQSIDAIMLENEKALLGVGDAEVTAHLDLVLDTMIRGVDLGLTEEGVLPGPFEFHRKAKRIHDRALAAEGGDNFLGRLSSYALAVSEGNAAGRLAVTAPTLGSAGTLPAVAYLMQYDLKVSREAMRKGLLAAGLVGLICKTNASVAGADVGCQGEIGVASAMAAAMLAHAAGQPVEVTEIAAAMALEHHLGMSCDPVGGFVLIPCIERNAFGALKAYNAYLIASNEIASQHWEDLDRVVAAMLETGRALPQPFREMGTAGLGVSMVGC